MEPPGTRLYDRSDAASRSTAVTNAGAQAKTEGQGKKNLKKVTSRRGRNGREGASFDQAGDLQAVEWSEIWGLATQMAPGTAQSHTHDSFTHVQKHPIVPDIAHV